MRLPDDTPADRLRVAAARLRADFGREMFCDQDGKVCAAGAILQLRQPTSFFIVHDLIDSDPKVGAALGALAEYLRENADDLGLPPNWVAMVKDDLVPEWNDSYAKDGQDAAGVLEKAAARWEERNA